MKKLIMIIIFAGFWGFQAMAQNSNLKSNYPYYTISKEVQRIQFKNVEHSPAKITIVSPALTSSKGTARFAAKETGKPKKMVRAGYPAWTISKGVARKQFEKRQTR